MQLSRAGNEKKIFVCIKQTLHSFRERTRELSGHILQRWKNSKTKKFWLAATYNLYLSFQLAPCQGKRFFFSWVCVAGDILGECVWCLCLGKFACFNRPSTERRTRMGQSTLSLPFARKKNRWHRRHTIKMPKDLAGCFRNELLSFHNSKLEFHFICDVLCQTARGRQMTTAQTALSMWWETGKPAKNVFICSGRVLKCRGRIVNCKRRHYKFSQQSRAPIFPRIYFIQNVCVRKWLSITKPHLKATFCKHICEWCAPPMR